MIVVGQDLPSDGRQGACGATVTLAEAAGDTNRRGTGGRIGIGEPGDMLGGADQRDGALDPGQTMAAAARLDRARDRKEALPVGKFHPLR